MHHLKADMKPGTMVVRKVVQDGEVEVELSIRSDLPDDPRRLTRTGPPAFWQSLINCTMVLVFTG